MELRAHSQQIRGFRGNRKDKGNRGLRGGRGLEGKARVNGIHD